MRWSKSRSQVVQPDVAHGQKRDAPVQRRFAQQLPVLIVEGVQVGLVGEQNDRLLRNQRLDRNEKAPRSAGVTQIIIIKIFRKLTFNSLRLV
jgi:hypothetical protein